MNRILNGNFQMRLSSYTICTQNYLSFLLISIENFTWQSINPLRYSCSGIIDIKSPTEHFLKETMIIKIPIFV